MKQLLSKNPEERPSAEEVLKHNWFTKKTLDTFGGYQDNFETCQLHLN